MINVPYITFREPGANGDLEYYILQKEFPHYLGRIVTYPVEGAIINQPIAGYNMWVTFEYTLRGKMIPGYKDVQKEIEEIFFNMAAWFWAERIVTDTSRYKKFKINATNNPK